MGVLFANLFAHAALHMVEVFLFFLSTYPHSAYIQKGFGLFFGLWYCGLYMLHTKVDGGVFYLSVGYIYITLPHFPPPFFFSFSIKKGKKVLTCKKPKKSLQEIIPPPPFQTLTPWQTTSFNIPPPPLSLPPSLSDQPPPRAPTPPSTRSTAISQPSRRKKDQREVGVC